MSSKGQIVIPGKVRKMLGLQPGRKLDLAMADGVVTLRIVPPDPVEASFGMFKQGKESAVATLLQMRRSEEADWKRYSRRRESR